MDTDKRLKRLEVQVAYLSSDLQVLRTLVGHDYGSALNKIRYLTEKVLHRLCKTNEVSWGKGEPTVENMIGPLVARKVIPRNVSIHIRTIQTNASPGSHYQEAPLSVTHVHVAQMALLDFLEWYCRQEDASPGIETGPTEPAAQAGTAPDAPSKDSESIATREGKEGPKSRMPYYVIGVLVILLAALFAAGILIKSNEASLPPEMSDAAKAVKAAVLDVFPGIKRCFEAGLKKHEDLEGRQVFRMVFKAGKDGYATVTKVEAVEDKVGSALVGACIMSCLREVKIKAPTNGEEVVVT